ncbi:MAG: hypothetical protein HQL09_09590 [Nitrospirae bacterium]|nr:hypothetical protein [Nitrospirota bacterium]
MGLLRLAEQLSGAAETIRKHADELDDSRFIKEADRFAKALDRFDQALESVRQGLTPKAAELKMLLQTSFPLSEDSFSGTANFSLKVLGKKAAKSKSDTPATYLAKVFKKIVESGKIEEALHILRMPPKKSVLDLSADDELGLLEQVRTLGGLDEEQMKFEVTRLVKHKKELFKLADAAKIKYRLAAKPETVAKKLVQAGRRYYENTGGWDLFQKQRA